MDGNLAGRAARWSAAHWKSAFFGWIIFVIIAVTIGNISGVRKLTEADYTTRDSARAQQILSTAGFKTPVTESILIQSDKLTVNEPAFKAVVADVANRMKEQSVSQNVISPLTPIGSALVSPDRHSALVQVFMKGDAAKAQENVQPLLDTTRAAAKMNPDFYIAQFGPASATKELNHTLGRDFQKAEYTTLPLTLVILLFAFGALVAAGLPVLLAFSGVLATTGISALISHLVPADDSTKSVILLIGMAVGVDYCLFYIRREREERARGLKHPKALFKTASTSGQAILISGITVFIAMAGMLFTGSKIFNSFGIGTMLMVAVALVGSLSILPATLYKLGDRVNKGKLPYFGRHLTQKVEPRAWSWILDKVLKRPVISMIISAGALIALALPALGLHTQLPSFTDLPKNIEIVQTYRRIQQAFPGSSSPTEVVIQAQNVTEPKVDSAISALKAKAIASGQMFEPIEIRINPAKTVAVVSIPTQGAGSDNRAKQALTTLRQTIIPETLGKVAGVTVAVTGETAGTSDFNDTMKSHAPIVFGFVLLLVFILLLVWFRSIVIPIKAVLLNLLSVGAAYGLLVLVFQHTWAEGLLNFQSNGSVVSWLPMFLFVILFGLSMDYHVFILSRIKELVDDGLETKEAVSEGIKRTAVVVTSAALVMIAVFAVFATLNYLAFKQMGIGLAFAILIDATIVRAVLLPSTMKILGDWNWYLPKWLEWLPKSKTPRD